MMPIAQSITFLDFVHFPKKKKEKTTCFDSGTVLVISLSNSFAYFDYDVKMSSSSSSSNSSTSSIGFDSNTRVLFFNAKPNPVARMIDYDWICGRETPSVAAIITPGTSKGLHKCFFGTREIFIPIYGSITDASAAHQDASVVVNFASFRSAYNSTLEALQMEAVKTIVIVAEGVPESQCRKLNAIAKKLGKLIIGPSTVGFIVPRAIRIADTAGTIDNIIDSKLTRPGSVAFVSKSGGMSNEMYHILSRPNVSNGICIGVAIGGDVNPGSGFIDHCLRFEQMPEVKMIVMLGELGGASEYAVAEAVSKGEITKPVCAWVTGTCAKLFPSEVQFGHAGAKSGAEYTSADAKNKALAEAGCSVPGSFQQFPEVIAEVYQKLVEQGEVPALDSLKEPEVRPLPEDYHGLFKQGAVRRATGIVSTICDDRGEEPTYAGVEISTIITENYSLGDVVSLLWFKRKLPSYASRFIEMCLMLVADHGPCVSGAHSTIVAARAGKDIVSCLCSGLLTIGPRFGGAIDDSARFFRDAYTRGLAPEDFVAEMKAKGKRIPGIGHRIKSAENRDKRVELLREYAEAEFADTSMLKYALEVEAITLKKASNLVLNVDGCLANLFIDLMVSCASFSEEEITEILEIGYLNALFVLGR
eukprot:TRINITY_DN1578_c0_g2_i10.p1 TRINITY_DN1578_c0_g2~~TRINITY_DN1578_c0_g2_i10.p1  ORF type:complete len:644 (+),score=170.93 TRINITY_DN1578_c0_g2_i10:502-2433(+)